MERASDTLRWSGARLLSGSRSSAAALHKVILQLGAMRRAMKHFATAQHVFHQDMADWLHDGNHRACDDVLGRMSELSLLWSEVLQREFNQHLRSLKRHFESFVSLAQVPEPFAAAWSDCRRKAQKTREEAAKMRKGGQCSPRDLERAEARLLQGQNAVELARNRYQTEIRVVEVAQMIKLKQGLLKLCELYQDLGHMGQMIFTTGHTMVSQLPDIGDENLRDIRYEGAPITARAMSELQDQLKDYRMSMNGDRSHRPRASPRPEAPPPYCAIPHPFNPHYPPSSTSMNSSPATSPCSVPDLSDRCNQSLPVAARTSGGRTRQARSQARRRTTSASRLGFVYPELNPPNEADEGW